MLDESLVTDLQDLLEGACKEVLWGEGLTIEVDDIIGRALASNIRACEIQTT